MMRKGQLVKKDMFARVSQIIELARGAISYAVNFEMVKAYWLIGREIVKEEQKGYGRAEYGKKIIDKLSLALTMKYGAGWSSSHLWHVRQFYSPYKEFVPENLHTLCAELPWRSVGIFSGEL